MMKKRKPKSRKNGYKNTAKNKSTNAVKTEVKVTNVTSKVEVAKEEPKVQVPEKTSEEKKHTEKKDVVKRSHKNDKKNGILTQTLKAIEDCINLSVDTSKYDIVMMKNTKKLSKGQFTVNVRIVLKAEPGLYKTLLFVVDMDIKTSYIHTVILDSQPITPNLLFTSTDQYPITKIEKYVPSIVISTQNMIK